MTERRYPLAGLHIVEIVDGPIGSATRQLAELGADVLHVVGPDGPASLDALSLTARDDFDVVAAHAGKRWLMTDPDDLSHQNSLRDMMASADIILVDRSHGLGRHGDWAAEKLRADFPAAIIALCSNFGEGNSFFHWEATDPVFHALSAELSRSGIRGRAPLLPPGNLAIQCAAAQLAYVLLLALVNRQRTGKIDLIDFSVLDAAMQALDPGYGISGSATMGRAARLLSPDRPVKGILYPIFRCVDGLVRIYIGAARQWQGLFEWMGRPDEFASPDLSKMAVRLKTPTLYPAIGRFFETQTRAELEAGAMRHGVPLSAMLTRDEAVECPHVTERGVFHKYALGSGKTVLLPNGLMEIDGVRMGPAPLADHPPLPEPDHARLNRPLDGIKVLDLGVIVVGGEQSRLLADNGADVIKLESRAFPDGTRQTDLATGMAVSLAAGHRNKRSLGLNLRDPEGKALFEQMVRQADVVLTNFKPGTMDSLGLGYARLKQIRPDIIMVESSAFGSTGPWAKRMGYGPLVRAASGLSGQWCYAGDADGHSDSLTIYPDHVAARLGVIGVLALLVDRQRSCTGGLVSTAQLEIALGHQAAQIAARAAGLDHVDDPPDAPWGVFPTMGDDQWCVVTVRNDADWKALCGMIPHLDATLDRAARTARRAEIDGHVRDWLANQDADQAAARLQAASIPAARMLRVAEQPDYGYYRERGIFRVEQHPHLPEPYHSEAMHVRSAAIATPDCRPAPLMGEHTAEVMTDWLGLSSSAINNLVSRNVLEPVSEHVMAALAKAKGLENE
jgi:crotonobetainyl-CoA:carnitine CoA-transferase CaiB-like acyl-CoA transferase